MSFRSMTPLSKNRHDSLNVSTLAFLYGGPTVVIPGELFVLAIANIRKMIVGVIAIDPRFEITTLLPFAP